MEDIYNEDKWINWVDQLSEANYLVIDNFISDEEEAQLLNHFEEQMAQDKFDKAGIGQFDQFQVDKKIRGDYVKWLNRATDLPVIPYMDKLDHTIKQLNRYCYLSLSGYECHLAHYPPGTYYKRHLDQFQNNNNRLISVVLYLNKAWKEGDGGELKLYLEDKEETVAPISKRLVLMRSELVEHEVLTTYKDRYSITGWLLYRPVGLSFLRN